MSKASNAPFSKPRKGPKPKYPFRTMRVGEIFAVPRGEGCASRRSMQVYCSKMGTRLGRKFHVSGAGVLLQVYRSK